MSNFFPWDEIPDSSVVPTGIFRMEWIALEDTETKGSGGKVIKRMLKAKYKVVEPEGFAGMPYTDYYVVGTDTRPMDFNPRAMGAQSFKSALVAGQVPKSNDIGVISALIESAKPQLLMQIEQYQEESGQPRNRTNRYYKLGTQPIGLAGDKKGQPVGQQGPISGPASPPPAPPVTAPSAPKPPTAQAGASDLCSICAAKGHKVKVAVKDFSLHITRHQQDPNWDGVSGEGAGVAVE